MGNIDGIGAEKPEDFEAIRAVNIAAFDRSNEANLVDRLRAVSSTFSFVAILNSRIVGHIFFSPVSIEGDDSKNLSILGLAPLAVLPEYQRQGIGTSLVRYGLAAIARHGCNAVVVLGHPEYYSRFGFSPASRKKFKCEYAVPDEAFLILELQPNALQGYGGTLKYRAEFAFL